MIIATTYGVEDWFWFLLLLGNYDIGNWLFPFISIHLLSSFVVVNTTKELRTERKKTEIPLNLIFISGVYDYLVVWEYYPESVEIAVLPSQRVWRISEIVFIKLWICGSAMYICVQSVCSDDAVSSS